MAIDFTQITACPRNREPCAMCHVQRRDVLGQSEAQQLVGSA